MPNFSSQKPSFTEQLMKRVQSDLAAEVARIVERVLRDAEEQLQHEIREYAARTVVNVAGWVNVMDRGSTIGIEIKMPPKGGN